MHDNFLSNVSIVLVGTLQPGNIGSVARVMKNTGLSRLCLARPQCRIDNQSYMMATHASDILDSAVVYSSLHEAIADCACIVGTTARNRKHRRSMLPEEIADRLCRIGNTNRTALVFGPEDSGLQNSELELCSDVVSIPTAHEMSSMNISHAVAIVSYEMFRRGSAAVGTGSEKLASSSNVEALFDHMRSALLDIGYLNPQNPDHVLGYFRRILTRAGITEKDVRTIRGLFRQLQWYIRNTRDYRKKNE